MTTEENIFALAQKLENTEPLQTELQRLRDSLQNCLMQHYLGPLAENGKALGKILGNTPSREITLLRAMGAFADEDTRSSLQQMGRLLRTMQTVSAVDNGLQQALQNPVLTARSTNTETPPSPSPRSLRMAGMLLAMELLKNNKA